MRAAIINNRGHRLRAHIVYQVLSPCSVKELLSSLLYQWEGRMFCTCYGVDNGHSGLDVNGPHWPVCLNTWLLAVGMFWEVM